MKQQLGEFARQRQINDPFARVFLDAAGDGMWNWFAAPDLPAELTEAEPVLPVRMQSMVNYMASRAAFFDGFSSTPSPLACTRW